ncbi:MAG: pyruvate ferredoxin oxidoreductase [Candidatus Methanoplasma sp.]|nr:pyruvate ferredoxin oxidoreductase [Candidatus Methanoplasma sp.]
MTRAFVSGNEALALGVRLAAPKVVCAYPITPQTTVVERLSEMVADGSLNAEFIYAESEHSAMSCAIGASAAGARAFTATSSQGLLYMAECLPYAAGGRFPIVMMNANRSVALPWNIYGDQRDSISQLDCGWIQAYAQDAQEALDLALMSYRIAERPDVSTPFMINLDGFSLTHACEAVDVPSPEQARGFLPPYEPEDAMDFGRPRNMGFSAGPEHNAFFKYREHLGILRARDAAAEAEEEFGRAFGRRYTGLVEEYMCGDADFVLITLGSVAGACRDAADRMRGEGVRAGVLRIRYMRPFPSAEIAEAVSGAEAVAVLEKDVSFGGTGTVFANVNSALYSAGARIPSSNYIGGLGGAPVSEGDACEIFRRMASGATGVRFIGMGGA